MENNVPVIIEKINRVSNYLNNPNIEEYLKESIENFLKLVSNELILIEDELKEVKEYEKIYLSEKEIEMIKAISRKTLLGKEIDLLLNYSASTRSTIIKQLINKKIVKSEKIFGFEKGRPLNNYSLTYKGLELLRMDLNLEKSKYFIVEKDLDFLGIPNQENRVEEELVEEELVEEESLIEFAHNDGEGDYIIKQLEWMAINLIGEGETNFSAINHFFNLGSNRTRKLLQEMMEKGLIIEQKISTSERGRPSLFYFLTELGKTFFNLKNHGKPSESKLEKFSKHGSPEHGRLMLKTGQYLESKGYLVHYDCGDTTYDLGDNKFIRFDIKASKEDCEDLFIETERLRGGTKHIFNKLNNIWKLFESNTTINKVTFVFPNQETQQKFKKYLLKWCENNYIYISNKRDSNKKILTIEHTSFEVYKKEKVEEVFLSNLF